MPLTDADIAKLDGGHPLTDADIAAHDSQGTTSSSGDGEQPGFWSNFLHEANPVNVVKGLYQSATNPKAALNGWYEQSKALHDAAVDAAESGDYEGAAVHGINFIANVVPGLGQAMDEAATAKTPEEFKAKLGTALGRAASLKELDFAVDAAKATPDAVKSAANKVAEVAQKPGAKQIATGAVQGAGAATALFSGHPVVAGGLGLRAAENIKNGLAESGAPPEIYDQISKSLGGGKFGDLTPEGQATVIKIAEQAQRGDPVARSAPATPSPKTETEVPTADTDQPSQLHGKTMGDLIDEYIAARKAAAQPPEQGPIQGPQRVPVWQRRQAPIINAPADAAPAVPPAPAALPSGRVPGHLNPQTDIVPVLHPTTGETIAFVAKPSAQAAAADLAEELTGSREGTKIAAAPSNGAAFEAANRAKRAQLLADHFHDAGISYQDSLHITPANLTDEQWKGLLGGGRAPSPETLDQARALLAKKYAAGRNPKAVGAAMDLAKEMSQ